MRPLPILTAFALAGVVVAAPVPKVPSKIDPGKPWDFPDLNSKGWEKKESGLQVWDVKVGEGEEVKAGASVQVKYALWLTNGKLVDGGEEKPALTLPLNGVIKGWQEGMVGMKPGGIRRLVIPPELGYGQNGAGGQIPGNSTLVFVIEYIGSGK